MTPTAPNGWRTFLTLWGTQSLSVVGSALSYFAITIYLTTTLYPAPEQRAALAFALSAVALAGALPAIFGAPVAGAWADRHDRKRVMFACDLGSALVSLALGLLVILGALPLWVLVPLVALGSFLGSFHGAAFDTSYAVLVPPERLPRANGMMQTLWTLSGLLAPGLAAFLIALPALLGQRGVHLPFLQNGTALVFLLDGLTFLVAGLVLWRLHIPTPKRTDAVPKSLMSDVGFGFRYILARRPLLWLLGTFSVANFVGAPLGVFEPLIVKFTLGPDWQARGLTFEAALALLATVGGVGGVLGGVFISSWGGLKERRVLGVLVPMILGGLALVAFAFSRNLYLSAVLMALNFFTIPVLNAHSQAIWQTQVPPEMQGRVFSVRRLIAQCTGPFATFLAGIAGGLFPPASILLVLGIAQVAFCAAQLFNPYLRRVEDRAWLEELATRRAAT
ncbi:major facilitator superfamily transporter [Deinococcus aerius]|uniref:Major facilitator superfamily transporter n=1 Tax=Deinococcus aerius TaxID=200253 RepID=A0A2I9CVG8_9DEIO|nr:MFS transporter [Deinococcus aerius]GBF05923.1 major facilitator superfamily transporter [Deinococcus aerius]